MPRSLCSATPCLLAALLVAPALPALAKKPPVRLPAPPAAGAPGAPLPDLGPERRAAFTAGLATFVAQEEVSDGLGPVFNESSCAACHGSPTPGGDSNRLTGRFGKSSGGVFNPLTNEGGTALQDHAIPGTFRAPDGAPVVYRPEVFPPDANAVAHRKPLALYGDGLVDAVPDAAFEMAAQLSRPPSPPRRPAVPPT